MQERLFTPGPTEVRAELLNELARPQLHHRTEEFVQLYDSIQAYLKQLLFTENPVLLFTSSSTGAMEAAVTNGVKKRCLNLVNGAFGERWHEIAVMNGVPCDKLEIEWDKAIKPELVDEALASGKYDALTLVFNDTSTGVLNPLAEISEVMKKYDEVLFFVDAVSAMGGVEIRVDEWGIDMCLAGLQKAFGLPAGLAVASVSERLLARAREVEPRSYYFNLPLMYKYHQQSQTPVTPAIPQMFALKKQLEDIVEGEGIEKRFKRHQEMAAVVQEWALKHFDIYPEEGYWSPTITCILNTRDISVGDLNRELVNKYACRIASGYGKLKEKCFRIAHMGDLNLIDIKGLLAAIEDILGL
ncbi:MAG TPA: alanine--glyoxylate aminotransferase family protein [Halanaerobiaceae bacterium]|jgi:aspartate aminotransferase-like enzyme|nr:alanine--glyoxylate aminotransferase family protein [Bacillota bacterium]HHU92681.1 alanine--glyoxylate aminotransferase family protein [Halanaerobiaceae bacterium]HOA41057.1 alanine--glyoxylate aminotransferase family protein [Halanaerobiales bacterium]HPZ63190.1 alanine--glyoxylate aminotransferase family protein [Halanaerobiales bacterium]HQD04278.1 alanine--glyoxylate aminotransferase family protein [Halanaerobiales bacterium]